MDDYKFDRAWSCYQRGQHKQAIDILKELLSDDPNNALYHGVLAACLLEEKRLTAAEHELNIALQLNPLNPFLKLTHCRVLIYKNKLQAALSSCDEVLATEPESLEALLLKASILSLLSKDNERLECIEQALALAPDHVTVICALGEYYYSQGKLERAYSTAMDAMQMEPEDEEANILIGKIFLAQGKVAEAEYHAKFAILQNPNSKAALTLFSHIKMRKNIFLGLWWRFNTKISTMGNLKSSFILILGFLTFNLLSQLLRDLGYSGASVLTSYAWLALVAYSWFCIPLYYKQLKKELEQFQFNSNY